MRILLISCVSMKREVASRADELYTSPWFKGALAYAKQARADKVFVLSAKHGVLDLDQVVDPYDVTLSNMNRRERDEWGALVLGQLAQRTALDADTFVFLAGSRYRKPLLGAMRKYCVPMIGMGIGKQLHYLNHHSEDAACDTTCSALHALVHNARRFEFPFDPSAVPKDGIYILFERGEMAHGGDRIVRVGTHTGSGQLRSRLRQHFLMENKNRSIFRKNIGRAMLARDGSDYLPVWELDTTSRAAKEKYGRYVNQEFERELEERISAYIQENFSFVIVPEASKERRLQLESLLISTVSSCSLCHASNGWLGLRNPKEKIQRSGLWQVNELNKTPMSQSDLDSLTLITG